MWQTPEEFYTSKRWRRKRENILKRDNYTCQWCKRFGKKTPATVVHHIKHLEDCPEMAYKDNNLVSLCGKCHNKAHPEKAEKIRRRY